MKPQRSVRGAAREPDLRPQDEPDRRARYDALDPIFHERSRLALMTTLAAHDEAISFTELRALCRLTDGNLSRHLQKLADAGLVHIEKQFVKAVPNTTIQITTRGIREFGQYVEDLAGVVEAADRAVSARRRARKNGVIHELGGNPQ